MSKKAPRVQFNFMEDEVPKTDIKMALEEVDDDDYEVDTLDLPEVVEREEVKEENIFENNIAVLPEEVKRDINLEMAEQGTTLQKENKRQREVVKTTKLTKSGKPRKQMSEEHKEKLKYAREKAIESRRQKQKERQEQKEFEAQEKELLKKKKQKDFEKLKKEVNDEVAPEPSPKPQIIQQSFTKKDLEEAQLDAIIKYEAIRKERKAKKREEQLIQQQREEMKAKINRYGSTTNGKLNNRYDICY